MSKPQSLQATSPSDLLTIHQLRRQHRHLLDLLQKQQHHHTAEMADLRNLLATSKQEAEASRTRLEELETRFEDERRAYREDRRRGFGNEMVMGKRIGEVEGEVGALRESVRRLGEVQGRVGTQGSGWGGVVEGGVGVSAGVSKLGRDSLVRESLVREMGQGQEVGGIGSVISHANLSSRPKEQLQVREEIVHLGGQTEAGRQRKGSEADTTDEEYAANSREAVRMRRRREMQRLNLI